MKNAKRFGASILLLLIVGLPAVADCLVDPGILSTPPCSAAQATSDDPTPGQTSTPPSSNTLTDYVIADTAIDFVESVLSLF